MIKIVETYHHIEWRKIHWKCNVHNKIADAVYFPNCIVVVSHKIHYFSQLWDLGLQIAVMCIYIYMCMTYYLHLYYVNYQYSTSYLWVLQCFLLYFVPQAQDKTMSRCVVTLEFPVRMMRVCVATSNNSSWTVTSYTAVAFLVCIPLQVHTE